MGNDIKIPSSSMLVVTSQFVEKLTNFAKATELSFTNEEKQIVTNAIRVIDPIIKSSGYTWNHFEVNNVMFVLQQTAFLKLNPSAKPRECYFIVRKNYDKETKRQLAPTLEFDIEGAGNITLLRKFGVDVKKIKSFIVYEGDEFDAGEIDGWETKLPTYKPKFKSDKALYAVVMVGNSEEETQVLIASRDEVKKSILAHASNNGADIKVLRELQQLSIDDILSDEKWLDYQIVKTFGNKSYKTPLLSPAWTKPHSKESMIITKMFNHAVRRYPKNFSPVVEKLYEATFEEKYEQKVIDAEEHIEIAQQEYVEEANASDLPDADFIDETEIQETEIVETYEAKTEEVQQETIEEKKPQPKKDTPKSSNDKPNWF